MKNVSQTLLTLLLNKRKQDRHEEDFKFHVSSSYMENKNSLRLSESNDDTQLVHHKQSSSLIQGVLQYNNIAQTTPAMFFGTEECVIRSRIYYMQPVNMSSLLEHCCIR